MSTLLGGTSAWSAGTEGAAFMNIPVGAGPAAMGSAYTALASDAYAPTWNPGGLGFVPSTQVAAMHLIYLQSISYEYISAVHPLSNGRGIGFSAQYRTSGSIPETDINGNSLGSYTATAGAYTFSYGQHINNRLSLGLSGKYITSTIAGVSASAFAADLGSMYRVDDRLTLAAVLANMGPSLTYLNDSDPLPMAMHLGAAYRLRPKWLLTGETVFHVHGSFSANGGVEWDPMELFALRMGYRTDQSNELSAIAGLSMGFGLHFMGHEFAYAWVPFGDLGSTHYFSIVLRFGGRSGTMFSDGHPQLTKATPDRDSDEEINSLNQLLKEKDEGTR